MKSLLFVVKVIQLIINPCRHANEVLRAENEMLQNYYERDAQQVSGANVAASSHPTTQQEVTGDNFLDF